MMATVDFFIGLALGISLYLWQQFYFRSQVKKIIKIFSADSDRQVAISLPPLSLVRRELYLIDQKRQEMEQERDNWQTVIEQAPIGYLVVDQDNQLLWCNREAQSLLSIDRWRSGEVRLLLELVRSYELDRLIEKTRKTQKNQEKDWIFYFTRYASSIDDSAEKIMSLYSNRASSSMVSSIALRGYSFPLSNYQVGVFLVNLQPLVELSQSRDRTFSDLAHELKTPLTSISLVGENLLTRLKNPEHRWVEQMLKEITRLINLVQEWLDITRLQDDPTQIVKYESLELSELILSVWEILEPIAEKKQVTLNHTPAATVIIEGDRSRLIQVFLNLLDNAIKHSPPDRGISVNLTLDSSETNTNKPQAIIDIIDSGSGFAPSDLPHIFERLYRGDKSRTRNPDFSSENLVSGSGLGLAIARQIIYSHGGSINAQNHPQHGGAWIRVTLPLNRIRKN
ncbi:MAG: PAS domain-containing sensor histidine kinase [Xenococcaceae cyanobacterium MO_167.B27]|nr:PAS domain-containing sensor histidine kinase [Xenococcaceae cyanobacterium MO_167.B27]